MWAAAPATAMAGSSATGTWRRWPTPASRSRPSNGCSRPTARCASGPRPTCASTAGWPAFWPTAAPTSTAAPRPSCWSWANCRVRRWLRSRWSCRQSVLAGAMPANWWCFARAPRSMSPRPNRARARSGRPKNARRTNPRWARPSTCWPAASTTRAKPWPTATPSAWRWPNGWASIRAFAGSSTAPRWDCVQSGAASPASTPSVAWSRPTRMCWPPASRAARWPTRSASTCRCTRSRATA